MSNDFYNATNNPGTRSSVTSAVMRAEFTSIARAFDKLPPLTANKAIVVNAGGTALTATAGGLALAGDFTTTGAFSTTLVASANVTLTLPGVSATLVGRATTDTLTNKTFDTASNVFKLDGTTVNGKTGTGNVVMSTGPTMSDPVVGTQSTGDSSTKAASTAFVAAAIAAAVLPGQVIAYSGVTVPAGFLEADGSAVSRSTYATLFAATTRADTATITIASPAVVHWVNHGLVDNDKVSFETTGALPTGLSVGTDYYVIRVNNNDFQVSATAGGSAINTSGSQSGVHTVRHNPHGCGNGSTTFNVIDMRGRVAVGADPTDATSRMGTQLGGIKAVIGAAGGAATHSLTQAELATHNHSASVTDPGHVHPFLHDPLNDEGGTFVGTLQAVGANIFTDSETDSAETGISVTIGNRGSGDGHNNVQPAIALKYLVKT